MKLLIVILFPLVSFAQTTLVAHGNVLWLKNTLTNDSSKVVTERKVNDSLVPLRAWVTSNFSASSHTHDYTTLTNKPTIPTNTNQLTNGAAFLVAADITGKLNKTDTAAMLGAYLTAIQGKQASGNYASGANNTGDNAVNSTYTNDYRAANFIAGTNYLAPNGSVAAVTGVLPFASNAGSSAATSATTGTMTVNMTTPIITITPTGACTFNGSGGVTGQRVTFVVTTSGVSSFTLTWGTNYKNTGTLATGTTTAKTFCVSFLCTNGTQWVETGRTAAQ